MYAHSDASFSSMDEAQRWVLAQLVEEGNWVAPRGHATLEIAPLSFRLFNPRRRHTSIPARRWSLPLAIGEFCWHLSASDDVTALAYYAKRWLEFAGDGHRIRGSCYGKRIFGSTYEAPSNWDRLVSLLQTDPASRRAVLHFSHHDDALDPESLDVACASSIQFLIRNDALDAVLYMRSNDAVWGLPYDVFLFTMLQELLACQLDLRIGTYHHIAGSMHLYERHLGLADRIVRSNEDFSGDMPRMAATHQVTTFLKAEETIRRGEIGCWTDATLHPYWMELLEVLHWFRVIRGGRFTSRDENLRVTNSTYEGLLKHAPIGDAAASQ